jgi:hypothetical protein
MNPLNTLAAKIPIKMPEKIVPTVFPLVSESKLAAIGRMTCTDTERIPIKRLNTQTMNKLLATVIRKRATASRANSVRIRFFLLILSPSGIMKKRPNP